MSIQSKAMIFEYHLHGVGSGAKKDADMTATANNAAGVDDNAGHYVKKRYPREFLLPIVQVDGKIRKLVNDWTIPYNNYGLTLLPTKISLEFLDKWRALCAERDAAVDQAAINFPAMLAERMVTLNGNFRREDYPSDGWEFRRCFSVEKKIRPIPDESHILFDIGADEMNSIRQEMRDELAAGVQSGIKHLFQKLQKGVADMGARLKKNVEDGTTFHKTILTNLTDVLDKVPALNLVDDPDLNNLAAEIQRRLASIDLADLREEDYVKKQAMRDVDDILKKMEGYC